MVENNRSLLYGQKILSAGIEQRPKIHKLMHCETCNVSPSKERQLI